MGEVDREDRVGLCGQELAPGGAGPSGRRIEARAFKIFQMVEAGYRVAESDQLALDGL